MFAPIQATEYLSIQVERRFTGDNVTGHMCRSVNFDITRNLRHFSEFINKEIKILNFVCSFMHKTCFQFSLST